MIVTRTKYEIKTTTNFKKQLRKIAKQGKSIKKLVEVIEMLANEEQLEEKYKDHELVNDRYYKNCRECHIEPDWLLIYKRKNDQLVLLLFSTGSHSELFK